MLTLVNLEVRKIESRMEESAVFKKELDRIKQKIVQ